MSRASLDLCARLRSQSQTALGEHILKQFTFPRLVCTNEATSSLAVSAPPGGTPMPARRQRTNHFSVAHACSRTGKVPGIIKTDSENKGVTRRHDLHARAVGTTCTSFDSPSPFSLREGARKCYRCAKCPCLRSSQPPASE